MGAPTIASPIPAIIGSSTNHQNSVQTTSAPSPSAATMHLIPANEIGLYDATGSHMGGLYLPLMVEGALTPAHAACLAGRPAQRLLYYSPVCADPHSSLALVFMAPGAPNPLTLAPDALPFIVHALDAGRSVQIHAETETAIGAISVTAAAWLGGGHA